MVIWLTIPSHLATGTVPVILEWLISSLVEALVFLHSLQDLLAEHPGVGEEEGLAEAEI